MVMLDRRREKAERREHTGRFGYQDFRHPHLLRQRSPVHGPGATQHDQRELTRIVPALDGHQTDLVRHTRVDDAMDARRRGHGVDAEPLADRADGAFRGADVEGHRATGEALRIQVTQYDTRVRHRRLVAAAPVACRPGLGAGAARSHGEPAGRRHRHAAAAGADRVDVDDRQLQRERADRPVLGDLRPAVAHETDVGARAPDIDGDDVGEAGGARDPDGADHAGRGTR